MTFQFDTSGEVGPMPGPYRELGRDFVSWSDLSPFEQGYVEAMFSAPIMVSGPDGDEPLRHPAFSDLAPETLARIREDCAKLKPYMGRFLYVNTKSDGALFWNNRKGPGALRHFGYSFPPLTPYIGDDGKVYLKETT
jgi:hypothetical protein